ncbi:glutathione S-transferase family protein [Pseudomonas lalucatii]|uniref:Glutathione S-transferase family protein n=1 Tax=Pseudomonas lalucatii TaxID=1424203 RepID=A0ABS5PXE7_9PSED|nr:glutathione S-transferase family protein [Pseudomonas lalucatii]MBS7661152.1 glutathione S-transferase family protein [Pseudomonas lalucatii]MBS7691639.1 glutathione S-transferase family protein [Pseudomonas lalucatii]MBS7724255.1 glutathione S-transferase family protein [Pseudomonas lalucatii]QVM87758.1 glutathione S-transferase family protein [Pseudomonas lalucatii]
MSLTLYGAPLSPFVRKVRLYLLESGLDYQLEIVLPFGQPDWYYDLNPLGRIPALKDGDFSLADSSVICQYLHDKYAAGANLLGSGAEQRAQVRWLEKYADYELAPLCTFAVFRNRALKPSMGQPCDEAAVRSALEDKLPRHFDYLEKLLGSADFLVGASPTLADLALCCQLINMEHGGERLDPRRWPGLAGLYARIRARPSVQAVLPGEQKMLARMSGKA